MRRSHPPFKGKQFIGNQNTHEIHDLDNEDSAENGCQIRKIRRANIVTFAPDTIAEAHKEGFLNCHKCIRV